MAKTAQKDEVEVTEPIAHQQPKQGGSYVRQPDGTLKTLSSATRPTPVTVATYPKAKDEGK